MKGRKEFDKEWCSTDTCTIGEKPSEYQKMNFAIDPDDLWKWIENRDEEYKEALQDATLHFTQKTFSTRPCSTCDLVSEIIGQPFGCKKLNTK